jgi:hypothetical protein
VTSDPATLTVNPAPVAPTITTQPASRTVTAGQTATFSVTASGTAPLSYQWRKNGVAISGATAASYTTPPTTSADSGAQFTVVVSNSAGSVTSTPATLTVNVPRFTLSVSKTGSGTVTSSPTGISCGATCSATYNSGTVVTLTATPGSGSTFAGWSGGGCAGTGTTCKVTLTANTTVSASFGTAGVSAPVLMWKYGGCFPGPYCDLGSYASPAVADLDGDGQPDVIWGDYDVVALNGADGSLKWRDASNYRIFPSIAVADLTGDGTLEVVVARHSDELTVYDRFGNIMWRRNPFGGGQELRSLAVADLESDGRLEILVGRTGGDQTPQLIAFEPDGTVRPGWPVRHSGEPGYGWGLYNNNVVVADMNGDGLKEVLIPTTGHYITAVNRSGNQLGTSTLFNNISNAAVGPKVWSQVGVHVDQAADLRGYSICGTEHRPTFENSAPVVADVNGDGVPELIVVGDIYNCGTNNGLYYMPFILKLDRTRWSGSGFDWTVLPTPGPGSAPLSQDYTVINIPVASPAVADLDGDGFKEILFPSYDGKVHAYWLDKTEHGSWPYTVPATGASGDDFRFASEPAVADLDNDGHAEVIFTSWPKHAVSGVGQLHILDYLGRELHRVDLPPPQIGETRNGGLAAPTIANIDSDPDLEVVVGTITSGAVAYKLPSSANARILWGTGRGSYLRSGTAAPGQ